MNSFINMFHIQTILLVYIMIGFYCRRKEIITQSNQQNFINIILEVFMPCMVFHSFKNVTFDMLEKAFFILLVSFGICLLARGIGYIAYRNFPEEKKNILTYATLINNAGFAGLPLAQEVFGSIGLLYASVYLIPIRIFMWSSGITILSKEKTCYRNIILKLLKNPNILAVIFGLIRGLFQIPLPLFIDTSIEKISVCVSPLSMILVGSILSDIEWKSLFEKGVLFYASIRLFLMPLCTLFITSMFNFDSVMIGVSMILTSMPAATSTALLASKYQSNVEFASKLIFVSTILSLITAPFLMLFI